jgi:hypothetical protein
MLTSNGGLNVTGTFGLDGIEGELYELMIGQGAGNTPVWTDDLVIDELDVNGVAEFFNDVYVGSLAEPVVMMLNGGYVVTTNQSNTFTVLQVFGTGTFTGGIPPGTILAAINNSPDPTVILENQWNVAGEDSPVLNLRGGREDATVFEVSLGQSSFQGAIIAQSTLSTGSLPQGVIQANSLGSGDVPALYGFNSESDGIGLKLERGGMQLAATFIDAGGVAQVLDLGYSVFSIDPGNNTSCNVTIPSPLPSGSRVGTVVYIFNLGTIGTEDINVNGGTYTIQEGTSAAFIYIQTSAGTYAWTRLD